MKKVLITRKDIVFFLKMLPLVQIHPDAYDKAKAIVCEESNEKAIEMLEAAYDKKEIPKPECETDAIDKNIELAGKLGISGTPTIVFENGQISSGAMNEDAIIKTIDNLPK